MHHRLLVLGFLVVAAAGPVSPTPNLIIFGDSLSDTGNAAALTKQPYYWNGRSSNSYVWNEYTARLLDMNLVNRAYSGATSNNQMTPATSANTYIPSFHDQVVEYLSQNPKPSQFHLDNDIIEIEIGGNDVLHNAAQILFGRLNPNVFARRLADTIEADIKLLANAGYKKINLWNLPAIDKTPALTALGLGRLAKPFVVTINNALGLMIKNINTGNKSLNIRLLDLNRLMTNALQREALDALGIKAIENPCVSQVDGADMVCPNPDEYFFYDKIHPAGRMHYLWGIAAAVLARNPEVVLNSHDIATIAGYFNISHSSHKEYDSGSGITLAKFVSFSTLALQ